MTETNMNEKIIEQWQRIKALVEITELDVIKNAKGNTSAGVRARKGLRLLKTETHALVKLTVEEGKKAATAKATETTETA